MSTNSCDEYRAHKYFVADIVLVPAEGRAIILAMCTACGKALANPFEVAKPHLELELNSIQKRKLENERK